MYRLLALILVAAAALMLGACRDTSDGKQKVEVSGGLGGLKLRHDHKLKGAPAGSPIPIELTRNAAETTFKSTTEVADHQKLVVWPTGGGERVEMTGSPLKASYHHVGKVLTVEEGSGDHKRLHYFVSPVRWSTVPR